MSEYLFQVEQQNRLEQRGLLKRFSTKCYGKQETLQDIRTKKMRRFKTLSKNRNSKEYETIFLKYNPAENKEIKRLPEPDHVRTPKPIEKTLVIDSGDYDEAESEAADDKVNDDEIRKNPKPDNKKYSKTNRTKRTAKPNRRRNRTNRVFPSFNRRRRNSFLV